MKISLLSKTLLLVCATALSASSASSALVTWQLNPSGANANVGSASQSYTVSGSTIVARGYNNVPGTDTAHDLFFKQQGPIGGAGEHGLGIVGTTDNELQINSDGTPAQYIQLDLRSILAQGFTNGQISVGSVQDGESFSLYGSATQGSLGTLLGTFTGTAFDNQFISIPGFGGPLTAFVSVATNTGDVLPVAFRASITPVPEMSALFPVAGLIVAVFSTRLLRRRREILNAARV